MVSRLDEIDTNVILDNTNLERVKHTKFLRMLIDDCLSWKNHIACVSKTSSRNMGVMNKLKHFVPTHILHCLYCTLPGESKKKRNHWMGAIFYILRTGQILNK